MIGNCKNATFCNMSTINQSGILCSLTQDQDIKLSNSQSHRVHFLHLAAKGIGHIDEIGTKVLASDQNFLHKDCFHAIFNC